MKKYMFRNKILFSLLLLLVVVLIFVACGRNTVSFSMGVTKNQEKHIELTKNGTTLIKQNKEKIEDSQIVFNKCEDGYYENLYFTFNGNNIKNITVTNDNKTFYYTDTNNYVRCLDSFDFYFRPDPKKRKEFGYDMEADFETRWDRGEFDEIRNVYFNGQSLYDLTRSRDTEFFDGGSFYQCGLTDENSRKANDAKGVWYLDEIHYPKGEIVDVYLSAYYYEIYDMSEYDKKPKDTVVQENPVKANENADVGAFIYRYEKLFYDSQQKTLKEKDSFTYSDLKGETVEITVTYTNDSTEKFSLDISFDKEGNITTELKER